MKKLREEYADIVNKYIRAFEDKHDTLLEFWVADQIGTIAVIGDNFFNFQDIRYDIDNRVNKRLIWEWYSGWVDSCYKNRKPYPNFENYVKLKKAK